MNIKVLGTRGEIESSIVYHSKHSGILVDQTILLDLGEEEFLREKFQAIFITHLHPDHAFFVRRGEQDKMKRWSIPLYAPEKYEGVDIHVMKTSQTIHAYRVTPIPVLHSMKVRSLGYLVECGEHRIFYTGDVAWIEKKQRKALGKLDVVITEGSYIRENGLILRDKDTNQIYGHTGVPNLIRLFKPYTSRILLVHFGSWFYQSVKKSREKIKVLAKKNEMDLLVGYDGMEIKLL